MNQLQIELSKSTVKNGRIYFPIAEIKFFPADSLSERESGGHKGADVTFVAGRHRYAGPVRIYSSKRLSPQRSFAEFFSDVGADVGDTVVVTRVSEREYEVQHVASR